MLLQSLATFILFSSVILGIAMIPLSLPGTWLILAASCGYAIFFPFDQSAWTVNLWLLGLASFGELMEFLVSTWGCKPFKVSNGAITFAFLGSIVGAIVGVPVFLVGSILGLFIGAFLGALTYEWWTLRKFYPAFRNACAVLATRIVATVLKTLLALGMGIYLLFKIT